MKKLLLAALLAASSHATMALGPWRLKASSSKDQATLAIDLYEESLPVPGMDMFGPMNGYLMGKGIYGVWMVTSVKIKSDREATIHLSNDLGSETQHVRLTLEGDSTLVFEQTGGTAIKKVVGRKLAKIPAKLELKIAR